MAKKKSNTKSFVKGKIKDLKKQIAETLKVMKSKRIDEKQYNALRKEINAIAVEAICGMELKKQKKKEYKIKFYKKATSKEVVEIVDIIDSYVVFERELYKRFEKKDAEVDDLDLDLEFPDNDKIDIKKVNMKKFISALVKCNKGKPILKKKLNSSNMIKLKALSDDVRKQVKRKKRIMIGGIIILISAAVITGGIIASKKLGNDDDYEDMNLDDIDDISDIDADVPHVDI